MLEHFTPEVINQLLVRHFRERRNKMNIETMNTKIKLTGTCPICEKANVNEFFDPKGYDIDYFFNEIMKQTLIIQKMWERRNLIKNHVTISDLTIILDKIEKIIMYEKEQEQKTESD